VIFPEMENRVDIGGRGEGREAGRKREDEREE
jgi:hypothetical protein